MAQEEPEEGAWYRDTELNKDFKVVEVKKDVVIVNFADDDLGKIDIPKEGFFRNTIPHSR